MKNIEPRNHRERVMDMMKELSRKHREEFGERVRKLKEQGFSMKETSKELDISMHMVSSLWQEFKEESE